VQGRYRDWVVRAPNRDLPYDTPVDLRLAGDQVSPGGPAAFIATGLNCFELIGRVVFSRPPD
jgi:hypothetical protein